VLEGCGKPDDKCYQDVLNTLQSADFDLDKRLERRGLGQMISKTVKGAWDLFFDIAAMLLLNWQMKSDKMDNSAFHIPITRAQEAANSASATSVVHSAGGSVVITVTPTSSAAKLTGYVCHPLNSLMGQIPIKLWRILDQRPQLLQQRHRTGMGTRKETCWPHWMQI
jgi:hypothetical protein